MNNHGLNTVKRVFIIMHLVLRKQNIYF